MRLIEVYLVMILVVVAVVGGSKLLHKLIDWLVGHDVR